MIWLGPTGGGGMESLLYLAWFIVETQGKKVRSEGMSPSQIMVFLGILVNTLTMTLEVEPE